MGLGKTAQSIAALEFQRQFAASAGPFLVVAPLTTLGHWAREIATWTTMDAVVFSGGAADREVLRKHDLWLPRAAGGPRRLRPHVLLASYEAVLRDAPLFQSVEWGSVVIDEGARGCGFVFFISIAFDCMFMYRRAAVARLALIRSARLPALTLSHPPTLSPAAHRMKSVGSATREAVVGLETAWLLALTGTPVQNNLRELFGLLNLLDPGTHGDEGEFLARFGDDRA